MAEQRAEHTADSGALEPEGLSAGMHQAVQP